MLKECTFLGRFWSLYLASRASVFEFLWKWMQNMIGWWKQKLDFDTDVIFSFMEAKAAGHSSHAMIWSVIFGQWRNFGLFMLLKWGRGYSSDPLCCFLSCQRLVEAAEEAHLKHEFDADLQVIDYSLSSIVLCVCCQRSNTRYTGNTRVQRFGEKALERMVQGWNKCACFLTRQDSDPQPFSTMQVTIGDNTHLHACNQVSSLILGELISQLTIITRAFNGKLIR